MNIKDFTRNPNWGVCVYKVPYVRNQKIISPGILIFNKIFLYRNPKRKDRVNPDSYRRVMELDSNLWIKGIYNSGSLAYIKKKGERWKKEHETAIEDWEKFDFAMPFREGLTNKFAIPLSLCSFVNPSLFKPRRIKKEFDICMIDSFDKEFKTQLNLAKAVKLFEKRYRKKLRINLLGAVKKGSKDYLISTREFMDRKGIAYRIGLVDKKDMADEINKCRINIVMKCHHGSPRAVTETASCNIPQIITDGFGRNVSSYFYNNMVNNKKYLTGVSFEHDNLEDICDKIRYVLDNINLFNPRNYILNEENCRVSEQKLGNFFKRLFESKGLEYKHARNHIFRLGKETGTSFESFYNADLKDVERLTKKMVYQL